MVKPAKGQGMSDDREMLKRLEPGTLRDMVIDLWEAMRKQEESYKMLRAAFDANTDETITMRARFEELWRVKISLENDVARLRNALLDGIYVCNGCEVPCRLDVCGKPFDTETAGCIHDGTMTGTNWKVAERKKSAESV